MVDPELVTEGRAFQDNKGLTEFLVQLRLPLVWVAALTGLVLLDKIGPAGALVYRVAGAAMIVFGMLFVGGVVRGAQFLEPTAAATASTLPY